MNTEHGFSLIELLLVVAIIAIIAAVAVPSMMTARMAANESGAVQGCRTIGSAEVAYAAVNNQAYGNIKALTGEDYLDDRFAIKEGFNGYKYEEGQTVTSAVDFDAAIKAFLASPTTENSTGRYKYGIGADQVVRYMGKVTGVASEAKCGSSACAPGAAVGSNGS